MCGIAGMFRASGLPVEPELLRRMTDVLRHRGPDGSGFYASAGVGLGHRRLSIIDLEGGAQPISNEDGTIWVVLNGEIYNFVELRTELEERGHAFRTRTDTEVIVHGFEEWGPLCVQRFNGIFAFALWDEANKRLLLARDHLGVKPLYYTEVDGRLLFASEIKSLLEYPGCPRQIDLAALSMLFTLRYVPSPTTLFKGIYKLPPATFLSADSKGVSCTKYWQWVPQPSPMSGEAELVERYRELLFDSVRLQMRSDVPVGLFLSSGVDSGALLALMSQCSPTAVQAFTIGFSDGEGGPGDEVEDARRLATQFGAQHSVLTLGPGDYRDYYERFLWDMEEPLGHEAAPAFFFLSKLAARSVKVVMCGQGADEPWAGYRRHLGVKLSELYSRLPRFVTDGMFRRAVLSLTRNERMRRGVTALSEQDILQRFVKVYSFFDSGMKKELFQPWLQDVISVDGREALEALEPLHRQVAHLDPLSQILYMDTRASLPDDLLTVADKTSMANSVEARVPYLDRRLVEFVESLPPRLKLHGTCGKYLHKKAVSKWIPASVIKRPKKGFDNPLDTWFRNAMRGYVRECLCSEHSAVRRYFNGSYLSDLVAAHQSGDRNYIRQINLLVSFELWHRRFLEGGPL